MVSCEIGDHVNLFLLPVKAFKSNQKYLWGSLERSSSPEFALVLASSSCFVVPRFSRRDTLSTEQLFTATLPKASTSLYYT